MHAASEDTVAARRTEDVLLRRRSELSRDLLGLRGRDEALSAEVRGMAEDIDRRQEEYQKQMQIVHFLRLEREESELDLEWGRTQESAGGGAVSPCG